MCFDGVLIDDSAKTSTLRYDYGFGIMNTVPNTYGSYMTNIGTWASNTFVMKSVTNNTDTVILTFKATSDTSYWVWNMANCSDSINENVDIKITKFSVTHSNGKKITFYTR